MDLSNIDLTKERFYVVLEEFYDRPSRQQKIKIECECGNIVIKSSSHTLSCKTCGNACPISKAIRSIKGKIRMANPKLTEPGLSGLRRLMGVYKTRSRKFNYEFSLDLELFKQLTSSNCYYCNSPPSMIYQHQIEKVSERTRINSQYVYNSLDRIDSDLGYTEDNVRPCCKMCNVMKLDHTEEDFKARIELLYKSYILKSDDGCNAEEHF